MTVLLDPAIWPAHGTTWSHLVSDASLAELHTFAARAGLPARSFDLDHYDVPASRHGELQTLGAVAVDAGTLVRRLRASGLRRTERSRAEERAALASSWRSLHPAPHDAGRLSPDGGRVSPDGGRLSGDDAVESPRWDAVGADLLARWGEKGRLHHGIQHLREVLDAVALLGAAEGADPERVRAASLAAWFHDAVHSSGRRSSGRDSPTRDSPDGVTDEDASADLARRLLTGLVSPDLVDDVARLVLLTSTHTVGDDDVAGALLSDADLAVLGASPQRYADYAAAIRQEYAHVPDADFRPGRAAILEALHSGALFHTPTGRARWEAAARRNFAAEVAALRA